MSYYQHWRFRAFLVVLALASVVFAVVHRPRPSPEAYPNPTHSPTKPDLPSSSVPPQLYPYSVILGGVRTAGELKLAVAKDGVAKAHYASFNVENAHPVFARQDMLRYVSYRKNNQVYWTAKPVRIRQGELLLADGGNFARSRCGNRISATSMQPTEAHPPANLEDSDSLNFVFGPYPPADFALPSFSDDALTTDAVLVPNPSQIANAVSGADSLMPEPTPGAKALSGASDLARSFAPVTTGGTGILAVVPRTSTGAAAATGAAGGAGAAVQGVLTPEPSASTLVLGGVLLLCFSFRGRKLS